MNNAKNIIIVVLVVGCGVLLFLWLGSIGDQAKLRESISKLEDLNRTTQAEVENLRETNTGLESTIDRLTESERIRQEKYREVKATIGELQENRGELEEGIDGILQRITELEKTISKLLDLVFD